jgi:hypothetical protein
LHLRAKDVLEQVHVALASVAEAAAVARVSDSVWLQRQQQLQQLIYALFWVAWRLTACSCMPMTHAQSACTGVAMLCATTLCIITGV